MLLLLLGAGLIGRSADGLQAVQGNVARFVRDKGSLSALTQRYAGAATCCKGRAYSRW